MLSRDEDPTFDLTVPQGTKGRTRKKRALARAEYEATLAKLTDAAYRDVLTVQGGTGMHVTEAYRLAAGAGDVGDDFIAIEHKRGTVHRQVVAPSIVEAARRMQARGGFSMSRYAKAIRKAARDAGIRPWSPGSMRHTVTCWLLAEGNTLAEVSTWLGHLSPATTKRFYSEWATIPLPGTRRAALTVAPALEAA